MVMVVVVVLVVLHVTFRCSKSARTSHHLHPKIGFETTSMTNFIGPPRYPVTTMHNLLDLPLKQINSCLAPGR